MLRPVDDLGSERVTRLLGVVDLAGSWWDLDLGGTHVTRSCSQVHVKDP
jgi:hypothetical protein